MAIDSSILAGKILWIEESGGRQSMSSKELDTGQRQTATMIAIKAGFPPTAQEADGNVKQAFQNLENNRCIHMCY